MSTENYYYIKRKAAYISLIIGFLMLFAKMSAYLITRIMILAGKLL